MRELFPPLKEGDVLGAGYLNRVTSVVGRLARYSPAMGYHGESVLSEYKYPPFTQAEFVVTEEVDADYRLYRGSRKWYNPDTSAWETDTEEWDIDALVKVVRLMTGDTVPVYWDEIRGMFVPQWVPTRRKVVVTEPAGIPMNGSGLVTFYKNGSPTSWVETAHFNWVYASDMTNGQRMFAQFYYDENKWVLEIPWC